MLCESRKLRLFVPSSRPAVSHLQHWPELRAIECQGCGQWTEIPIEVRSNPEKFCAWREELEALHAKCGKRERVH